MIYGWRADGLDFESIACMFHLAFGTRHGVEQSPHFSFGFQNTKLKLTVGSRHGGRGRTGVRRRRPHNCYTCNLEGVVRPNMNTCDGQHHISSFAMGG